MGVVRDSKHHSNSNSNNNSANQASLSDSEADGLHHLLNE